MEKTPIAIFRKKADILIARDMNKIKLADEVTSSSDFITAKMNDLLAFKVVSGSDYTAIGVKAVQNDPRAFMEMAFGKSQNGQPANL